MKKVRWEERLLFVFARGHVCFPGLFWGRVSLLFVFDKLSGCSEQIPLWKEGNLIASVMTYMPDGDMPASMGKYSAESMFAIS